MLTRRDPGGHKGRWPFVQQLSLGGDVEVDEVAAEATRRRHWGDHIY